MPPPSSIVCPRCGRRSFHPEDIRHRYCGACALFHVDMNEQMAARRAKIEELYAKHGWEQVRSEAETIAREAQAQMDSGFLPAWTEIARLLELVLRVEKQATELSWEDVRDQALIMARRPGEEGT